MTGLFRAAGVAAIGLGLLYVVIIAAYLSAGAMPGDLSQALTYLSLHAGAWRIILVLSVLTDLLFLPVIAALYVTLAPVGKAMTSAGAGLIGLFVLLDLAVTWPNYSALMALGDQFGSAVGDTRHSAILAAAT